MQRSCWVVLVFLCVAVMGADRRRQRGIQRRTSDNALQQKFESIYTDLVWGDQGGGSGTGSGQETTQNARSILRLVVNLFGIRSLADCPCGSMHWMPILLRDLRADVPGFQYLGVDVVRKVIEGHRVNFQNNSHWMHFQAADFTVSQLPQDVDLIFCRDALQHLSLDKVVSALELFSRSSARFLLVGSYLEQSRNINITTGDYWDINLLVFPFELTGYEHAYSEHSKDNLPDEPNKFLLLFPMEYLRSVDYERMMQRATLM